MGMCDASSYPRPKAKPAFGVGETPWGSGEQVLPALTPLRACTGHAVAIAAPRSVAVAAGPAVESVVAVPLQKPALGRRTRPRVPDVRGCENQRGSAQCLSLSAVAVASTPVFVAAPAVKGQVCVDMGGGVQLPSSTSGLGR
jgi:hypothetical protein